MKKHWLFLGALLGSIFFLAIWLVKPIGISTQFSVISAMGYEKIEPNFVAENAYMQKDEGKLAKKVQNPLNYDLLFFLSVPFGAFVAFMLFSKERKMNFSFNLKEALGALLGGFLLLYGARMAGGCTSGHMMSGIMQSSLSGFVFAISVFAVGISWVFLRRGK